MRATHLRGLGLARMSKTRALFWSSRRSRWSRRPPPRTRRASPSSDDPPSISLRPFFLASGQNFTAKKKRSTRSSGRTVEPLGWWREEWPSEAASSSTLRVPLQGNRRARVQVRRPEFRLGIPLTSRRRPGGRRRLSLQRLATARALRRSGSLVLLRGSLRFLERAENVKDIRKSDTW